MRVTAKDRIRFSVQADGDPPAELEIRVRPGRFDGWEATARLHRAGALGPAALGRVFRSQDRRLAVGKMVAWVRGRYRNAQPLAERRRPATPAGR